MSTPLPREFSGCEIPADLALVAQAMEKMRTDCVRRGLPPQEWLKIELAVVEGLNNAIIHGSTTAPRATVRLEWSWTDDVFEARILDPGNFYPAPAGEARLPEDPYAESGRGDFIIASMVDTAEHTVVDGKHCLTLRRRVGAAPPPASEETETILAAMTEDLSISYESLAAMFRFGEQLATAPSFDDFAATVLDQMIDLVQAAECYVRLVDAAGKMEVFHRSRGDQPHRQFSPGAQSVEMEVFRRREPLTVENCAELSPADPLWRESGCAFVCPVFFQDKAVGILTAVRTGSANYFSAGEISLISVVGDFLGIARTTSALQEHRQSQQRAMRELEIAAEIQQSLLPNSFPSSPIARIFGVSQTAHEVGGDYFDALPIGDHSVLLAIADVMGKGMPAALLATIFRTTIRARLDLAHDPGRLLSEVNRQMSSDLAKIDMFVTAQVAFFTETMDELIMATAGHCPLLHFARDRAEPTQITGGGVPLGVIDDAKYESLRQNVGPGDRFVFLTDGLYEAQSPSGEMIGLERIAAQIPKLWVGAPHIFCGQLLDYVREWSKDAPAADDRTLLVVERL